MRNPCLNREAWLREAASLDQQRRTLYERAKRGLISPEEFMKQMLRLETPGEGPPTQEETSHPFLHTSPTHYYLSRRPADLGGELVMTRAWLLAHRALVEEIYREVGPDPYKEYLPYLARVRIPPEGATPEHYSDFAEAATPISRMNSLLNLDLAEGREILQMVNIYPPSPSPSRAPAPKTEKEWNDWVYTVPDQIREFKKVWGIPSS